MTVTDADASSEPDVALIVAVPFATAVTRPPDETLAAAPDVAHVTLAPLIVAPFWSLTVAVSCAVIPRAFNQTLFGNNVIDVATGAAGVGGLVGVSPRSPHAASKSTAESRR